MGENEYLCKGNRITLDNHKLPAINNVFPSKNMRQQCSRMSPADKRYWGGVTEENLRLFHTIQVNSGSKPHHTDRRSHLYGKTITNNLSKPPLQGIDLAPRSHRPSERRYWSDVSRENKRLLRRILEIQIGDHRRSKSSPAIYPAPRRYYPSEVLYWNGVSKENNRLMNKIFKIDKGTKIPARPITMSARPRSASSPSHRSCSLKQKDSTYFNTYGRPCHYKEKESGDKVEVEVSFEDPDTFTEDFVAAHLVGEKMSVAEVRRAINAI